jgi:RimJ/RimL family protein N-acetyltransferase
LNQKFDPSHGKNLKDHVLDEEEIVLQIKKAQAESDIWLFIIDPTNKHDVPELRVEGGTIVGSCQLYWEGDTDGCHISCIIHHRFLRNGYARAALGAAIDYAFYTPHMKQETVILETMKTNAPFRGLMESLQLKDRETPGSYWAQADSPIESVS